MVYIKNENKKIERHTVRGKLVSVSANPDAVIDADKGLFKWLSLSIVKEVEGQDPVWFNITAYDVNLNDFPELQQADEILSKKENPKPIVEVQYYESIKVDNKDIDDQGRAKTFKNLRANAQDLKEFKIIAVNSELGTAAYGSQQEKPTEEKV